MATIVKYSTERRARNSFPYEIISPPFPSRCCSRRMARVGAVQEEDEEKFYYRRCESCGFTVREFLSTLDPKRSVGAATSIADPTWRWIARVQRQASAEHAA
ncbi:MAG: hypothetical protein C3F12_04785 [Candidatus Methylomirabilota bacterium]|nr:MAG: hypothetical protein C3F12_04785 [candidate division NC10 bacterium]